MGRSRCLGLDCRAFRGRATAFSIPPRTHHTAVNRTFRGAVGRGGQGRVRSVFIAAVPTKERFRITFDRLRWVLLRIRDCGS